MLLRPAISVIIPIYNVERYLKECLDSVINQTFRDIEIILVDDGSTDNAPRIIEDYRKKDKRIIVITKQNEGLILARKSGIAVANGSYIFHLDSDDYMELNALELLYNKALETGADIVVGDYVKVYEGKKTPIYLDSFSTIGQVDFIKLQLKWVNFYVWNKLIKSELYESIIFPGQITYGEDIVILSQLLTKVKIVSKVDHNVVFYRIRKNSLTNKISEKSLTSIYNAYIFNRENLKKHFFFDEIKEDFYIYSCIRMYIYFYKNGHITPFKEDIKKNINQKYKLKNKMGKHCYLFVILAKKNIYLAVFVLKLAIYLKHVLAFEKK